MSTDATDRCWIKSLSRLGICRSGSRSHNGLRRAQQPPGLHLADDVAARCVWSEGLGQKGPERNMQREAPLAAVCSMGAAAEERIGNEKAKGFEEIRQGVESSNLPQRFLQAGKGGTAKQNGRESLEERCAVVHSK